MSNFYDDMSPLEQILYRSSPRTHEYESLTGKIRRRERKNALEQIQKLYSPCTTDEAVMIYDAFKQYAVGSAGKLVEIDIDTMPARDVLSSRALATVVGFAPWLWLDRP